MAEILLRPARKADFPAIRALIFEARINPFGLDWRRFIVAETPDGQFAGCGQLKPHSDGSLELASIAVTPLQRGKGVARVIIQKLIESAPRPLYLTCRSDLGPFYKKFGFHAIEGSELPKYFWFISWLAKIINALHLVQDKMLVMVLVPQQS